MASRGANGENVRLRRRAGRRRGRRLHVERLEPRLLLAGVEAFYRAGQTFVTWPEDTAVAGEAYHVYRHTAPITSANLEAATRLTGRWGPIVEGSAAYTNERSWPNAADPQPRQRNFIITDDGPELPDMTGLFVWTTHEDGTFYYAVTTVAGGVEDRTIVPGQNATLTGVVETVATPAPIRVQTTASGHGFVYTQFMDYAEWNPTFDGYAYNYSVALPVGYDGSAAVPLLVYMQGWGDRYGVHDGTPWDFNSIWLDVDDPRQTWHYGYSADFDYRTFDPDDPHPPTTGTIVNFTEQRILQAVDEVTRLFRVDEQRIHGHGSSMGGSGMLTLGMRYPNVFAAVYAGLPMTDYAAADGRDGSTDWRPDLEPKWGTRAANLPIENRGPHAAHLTAYNGLGVWDWMDHQTQLVAQRGADMAYLCYAHTMQDDVIDWETQGQPLPGALEAGRIGFQGAAVPGGHSWPGFDGSNELMIGGDAGGGWSRFAFRRDMSFPAVSQASRAPPIPPPTSTTQTYCYHTDIEWSVPWHPFGALITDEPAEYGITLRSTSGDQMADITPRRLQRFVASPGMSFQWTNTDTATGTVLQAGTVSADADGLLTIAGVQIRAGGSRLAIMADAGSVLYVSPSGNDANPGTAAEPWRTLQHAAEQAAAGDTIIIQPGTYAGGITHTTPGAAGRPITYRAASAGQTIIDGSGSARDAFFITAAPWVVVDGLRIQNADRAGLRVSLSAHVTIRNSILANNGTWGIFTDYADDLLIENNECYGSQAEHGIYVSNSGDRPWLRNNRCHDNAASGIQINADPAMRRPELGTTGDGITTGAVIENNVLWANGQAGGAAINLASVRDSTIRNNLLYDNLAGGIAGWDDGAGDAWGTRDNTFLHNTIVFDAGTGRTALNLQHGSTGNTVRNNVLAGGGSLAIRFDPSSLAGWDSDYNLLYSAERLPAVAVDEETGEVYALAAWQALTGGDAHSLVAEPGFVDRGQDDYHLAAGSPARNSADPAILLSPDLAGILRPQETAPDMGALEFVAAGPSLRFPNTAGGIHVFSDQFPDGLSDHMLQFIAGHYDGAQKMRTVFTDAVRAYNDAFIMLHYRLAVGHGQHQLLVGDQWASDWGDVDPHADWFLAAETDPGRRLRQSAWDWYLMDIANSAWRAYWLQSTVDQMRAVAAQGVFADSWDVAAYTADVLDPWDARFAGTAPRDNGWTAALGDLSAAMVTGLSAAPEDFLYLPNLGALVTGWDDTDYAIPDGGMVEGFGQWGASLEGEPAAWQLQMNRVLELAGQDKVLLLQGTLQAEPATAAGLQHRLFMLGSYLLVKDDYTYINMLPPGGDVGVYYYPEYEVDLGAATTSLPADIDGLLWNGVYRRDFANGFVLVNPTGTERTIALGGDFEQLVPSGGGAMDDGDIAADGSYQGGALAWLPVSSLVLPVAAAALLRPATAGSGPDIFFLHQSTGQGIMDDHGTHPGLVRQLADRGYGFGDYSLWDAPPGGSIPTEIATLFADANGDGQFGDAFQTVPALHGAREADVLMLKSCFYTLAELENPAALAAWQQAFVASVAPYANQHPEQKLVVMPAVPLRAESGLSAAAAARARDWADWLAGDFLAQYCPQGNVYAFDLFNFWADAEDHPTNANALQRQYVRPDGDEHPNDAAYAAAADALTVFLTTVVTGSSWQNPVNPSDVTGDGHVTPLDALVAITYLNAHPGDPSLPAPPAAPPPYYDVNGDGQCVPLDVLLVIDYINQHPAAEGEAAADATACDGWSPRLAEPARWLPRGVANSAVSPAARAVEMQAPERVAAEWPTETHSVADRAGRRRSTPPRAAVGEDFDQPLAEMESLLTDLAGDIRDAWRRA